MDEHRIEVEREVLAYFFQLSNRLQVLLDQQLKPDHLTAKQLFMMIVVDSFETAPGFSQISERFGTSRQNVKQLLLKLEKNRYVKIYTDQEDARYKRVQLTPKAKKYWKQRDQRDLFMLNNMFQNIRMQEMQKVQETLKKVDENIQVLSGEGRGSELHEN